MSENLKLVRGYVTSRPFAGDNRVAQHVQNLVIRDYCQRNGLTYLLSATEYAMDNCYMILEELLNSNEVKEIHGLGFFSLFMLPKTKSKRLKVYDRILQLNSSLHFALESLSLYNQQDVERIEEIWLTHNLFELNHA